MKSEDSETRPTHQVERQYKDVCPEVKAVSVNRDAIEVKVEKNQETDIEVKAVLEVVVILTQKKVVHPVLHNQIRTQVI